MSYDEHVECDRYSNGLEDKIEQLQAENGLLKTALQSISKLEDKYLAIGCGYDIRVDIMAKETLDQCNNKCNDSSTGHTEGGETE